MSVEIIEFLTDSKSSKLLNDLMLSKDIALTEQEKIALANEFADNESIDENKTLPPPINFSIPLSKPLSFKSFKFKAGTELTCSLSIEGCTVKTWKATIGKGKKEAKL